MQYPIEYRTIKTQYAFFIEKTDKGFEVKSKILTEPKDQFFSTEAEARQWVGREIIN